MLDVLTLLNWLVGISGLFTWVLFVPQIRLILRLKREDTISLGMTWGSWVLQALILAQSLFLQNWSLSFTMAVSVFFLTITNVLIHYYRKYPGGRT